MTDHHHHQSNLLGSPELQRKTDSGEEDQSPNTGDLFLNSMIRVFQRQDLEINGPLTHSSSHNPCLDFYFHVIPGTPAKTLNEKLTLSWAYNPLTTLKLVCNLRAIRGTGKSDKEGFLTAALWLHRRHPRTLASNVASFAEFGSFNDLPEILNRLVKGSGNGRNKKSDRLRRKRKKVEKSRRSSRTVPREVRVSEAEERSRIEKERARELRTKKKAEMARKLGELLAENSDFRSLYEKVSEHLAEVLKNDVEFLNSGNFGNICPAAKGCPSIGSSYDRSLLLCESIGRKIFPREVYEEGLEEAHYAYRVRDRLRKEVLVPLRKALSSPEVSAGETPSDRVTYLPMRSYKDFLRYYGAGVLEFAISGEEYKRLVVVD